MPQRIDIASLFDAHFDDVYAYIAFRLAPHVDAAADIAQEVFHSAMRTERPLEATDSARAWLLEIARNRVTDHLRARVRQNHHLECFEQLLSRATSETQRDRLERAIRVASIMGALPQRSRELLEDKYILGLTVDGIAQRRGETAKAVESALSRARDAFRAAWRAQIEREENPSCETAK